MIELLESVKLSILGAIWGASLASLPPGRRRAVKVVRIVHMLLRELAEGTLTMRAASLVFTTLLSLVPLLAVSFSLLKAFGVHTRLEAILFRFLEPLGEQGVQIATRIVEFVDELPKTRSGKIMRRLLRELATTGEVVGDVTTLEDLTVLEKLRGDEDGEA